MKWFTEAITQYGNRINYSLGYEIYEEPATRRFCEKKPKNLLVNQLNEQVIPAYIWSGI